MHPFYHLRLTVLDGQIRRVISCLNKSQLLCIADCEPDSSAHECVYPLLSSPFTDGQTETSQSCLYMAELGSAPSFEQSGADVLSCCCRATSEMELDLCAVLFKPHFL